MTNLSALLEELEKAEGPVLECWDIRRKQGDVCVHCANWTKDNPDDWTAPEGHCQLPKRPGHAWHINWPATLAEDTCDQFKAKLQESSND